MTPNEQAIERVRAAKALAERLRPWSEYSFAEMHQGAALKDSRHAG